MAEHYGDETSIRTWLAAFDDYEQLTDPLLEEALSAADDFINSRIAEGSLPTPIPSIITRAANYWAEMEILDAFYNTEDGRSPTAATYERRANYLVEQYIKENPGMTEQSEYSYDHTPTTDDFKDSNCGYVDPDNWEI